MIEKSTAPSKSERRRETRHPVEVDIVVFSGKNYFRTKTMDVSHNGCQLKEPLPEGFNTGSLEVILTGSEDGKHAFQMVQGSMVEEPSRRRINLKTALEVIPI